MTHSSIYWIRTKNHSDILSEGYIGVSKDVKTRWEYGHFWSYKNNRHDNPKLSNAIKKHGWDNLVKEVIVIGDEKYCYEIEQKLRPTEEIGWNLAIGGRKPPPSKPRGDGYVSPLKGIHRDTPWMIGRVPASKGKKASAETRAKLSLVHKGKKHSPEHLEKRMQSRRITRIARGQIKPFIVNGIEYEDVKIASNVLKIPQATLQWWAYGKGKPSKKYSYITECRWK